MQMRKRQQGNPVEVWLGHGIAAIAALTALGTVLQELVYSSSLLMTCLQMFSPVWPILFMSRQPITYQLSSFSYFRTFSPEVSRPSLPRVVPLTCAVLFGVATVVCWRLTGTGNVTTVVAFSSALWLVVFAIESRTSRKDGMIDRVVTGHCPRCGYDLRSDLRDGCPECGWNRQTD